MATTAAVTGSATGVVADLLRKAGHLLDRASLELRSLCALLGRGTARPTGRRAQVASAWLLRQPGVTAPIVGATKPQHLDDAVASVDLRPSDDECKCLEEHDSPRGIVGLA